MFDRPRLDATLLGDVLLRPGVNRSERPEDCERLLVLVEFVVEPVGFVGRVEVDFPFF